MKEYEYKWLLSEEAYKRLLEVALPAGLGEHEHTLQINYYYDTENLAFRQKNTTIRIRQQNQRLTGTVKTHCMPPNSYEMEFLPKEVPTSLYYKGKSLMLHGQLITDRRMITLSPGIQLCLDQNWYWGKADYEAELEFMPSQLSLALQWKASLNSFFSKLIASGMQATENTCSKSERFFQALTPDAFTILEESIK